MPPGGYQDWLERERRIRLRILGQSPEIGASGMYRICADCAEVLLCHEQNCPNCGGRRLNQGKLNREDLPGRMRLAARWRNMREAV
jgi:hypothetical protein